jgi:hypothetical protein
LEVRGLDHTDKGKVNVESLQNYVERRKEADDEEGEAAGEEKWRCCERIKLSQ